MIVSRYTRETCNAPGDLSCRKSFTLRMLLRCLMRGQLHAVSYGCFVIVIYIYLSSRHLLWIQRRWYTFPILVQVFTTLLVDEVGDIFSLSCSNSFVLSRNMCYNTCAYFPRIKDNDICRRNLSTFNGMVSLHSFSSHAPIVCDSYVKRISRGRYYDTLRTSCWMLT